MSEKTISPHQSEFNRRYITSSEICFRLAISRSSITSAIRRGKLPEPIRIGEAQASLWVRDEVEPIVTEWKASFGLR